LGPYTAIPGLPVVRGPNWEFGDIHGELDSYGYLLEETKNGWIVYWLDSKKLFTVSTHNNTTCPLAYCPWGYHKPLVSAMGTPITDSDISLLRLLLSLLLSILLHLGIFIF
jgi:hypothetical protein